MEKLFEKMQRVAKRYVKYPLSGSVLDNNILEEIVVAKKKDERYVCWIVRPCGTDVVYKSHISYSTIFEYYLSDLEIRYYELDLGKKTITYIRNKYRYWANVKLS